MACVATIMQSSIWDMGYLDNVWDVWLEWLLYRHELLRSLSNTLEYLCEWMHLCVCVNGHFRCGRPIISHIVSLHRTVLRAGSFDIHGVLSTNVDRKKGCLDPFPLALPCSFLVNLIYLTLLCSCLVLWSVLLYCVLFCSALYCLVTSCLVLCHAVLTRIALFLYFTVPYSMPFYAMRHCALCVTLHNAPFIHFYVDFILKPYITVVFLYIHWSISSYIRSTMRHGACVTLKFSISSPTLLCSLSLHFCHFQVTMWSMSTCVVVDISNIQK